MNCIASVLKDNGNKVYNIIYTHVRSPQATTRGYYNTSNSKELLDFAKKGLVLNYIQHTGERTSNLLLQPLTPNKNSLNFFGTSQYCIGIAKGLRDRKNPKNFFDSDTKYVDASARSITSGKPIITLVPEMNLSHALNATQTMSVLKCVVNKAGVKIEDILLFNLTTGDFWALTSV